MFRAMDKIVDSRVISRVEVTGLYSECTALVIRSITILVVVQILCAAKPQLTTTYGQVVMVILSLLFTFLYTLCTGPITITNLYKGNKT